MDTDHRRDHRSSFGGGGLASANESIAQPDPEYRVDLEPEYHYHFTHSYQQKLGYRARQVYGGWQVQEIVRTKLNGATEWREGWLPRSGVLRGANAYERARSLVDEFVRLVRLHSGVGAISMELHGRQALTAGISPSNDDADKPGNPDRPGTIGVRTVPPGARSVIERGSQVMTQSAPDTLVSNTGQNWSALGSLGTDVGQRFSTGAAAYGYLVTGAGINLSLGNPSGRVDAEFRVSIWALDKAGDPEYPLVSLSPPSSLVDGVNRFSVPGGVRLEPGESYIIIIGVRGDQGDKDPQLRRAASGNEDPGNASGWSIFNDRHLRSGSSWSRFGGSVSLGVVGGTVRVLSLDELGANHQLQGQRTQCGGNAWPRQTFEQVKRGETWYCNTSRAEWVLGKVNPDWVAGVGYSTFEQLEPLWEDTNGYCTQRVWDPLKREYDANGNKVYQWRTRPGCGD